MKLQCPSCHKLALCDPGSGKSTGWVNRVAFADLVQGKGEGCTGCRLICEILPLLNDYREGPYGVPNLFVYSTGYGFIVESVVTLRSGTLQRIGLGIFELCKMNDESVPWSCVQDEIEVPKHRSLEPASDKAYDLIASWYATCQQQHDDCNVRKHTEGPTRLLDISRRSTGSPDTIRLVECDGTAVPDYFALSHAWGFGEDQPYKTVKGNFEIHKSGIETAALSRTFRDAVAVSRRLGQQYLWIDSLCIIQDDKQDKLKEIPRMQAIYEGAALTISAMSSWDGRGGCWIPRRRVFVLPLGEGKSIRLAFHRSLELAGQHLSFLSSQLDSDLYTQYPLATRKWALQERILSRRVLHFTAQDLVWECRQSARCDCGTLDILFPEFHTQRRVFKVLSNRNTSIFDLVFDWMALVMQFSYADLTDETDVFPALAGLASGFSNKGLGAYCAGLWEISLPIALCWYTDQMDSLEATNSRPSKYVAPTWSWASVQGNLRFDALDGVDSDPDRLEIVSELISVDCETVTRDEFGHVRSGSHLKICAPVCKLPPGSVAGTTISKFEGAEFRVDTLDDIPRERECIVALIFTKTEDESQALVLVADDDGTHRRCGSVCLPDQTLVCFNDWMEFDIV